MIGDGTVNHEDLILKICGSAGDGSISATEILNRAVAMMGYHIMNFDSFPAEIRGFGKSCGHTRITRDRALTPGNRADCLIALDDVHSITELMNLKSNGIVIYESNPPSFREEDTAIPGFIEPGMIGYGVPLHELSVEATRSVKSRNLVSLGIISGLFNLDQEAFLSAIKSRFASKKETVRTAAREAFLSGNRYVAQGLKKRDSIDFRFQTYPREGSYQIISGNESAAQGCIDAGIRLYAGYPITPATKIMEILAKKLPLKNGVVIQTEDEISAIGHVIGAGFAGRRSATATSGPGLCLMTECLNLGVMAEIPMVIINSQRGGPSTGLPTKTEQSDLHIALYGGSGDSPRPVIAPTTVEECYSLTKAAFDIADAFQTPVIILLDFFLSNRIEDIIPSQEQMPSWGQFPDEIATRTDAAYQRYRLTENGVSPRAIPGTEGLMFTATGLEHSQTGKPNYDADNHRLMTLKRERKMTSLCDAWNEPDAIGAPDELDIGIISWGSTCGSAIEALSELQKKGMRSGGFFPRLLYPLREDRIVNFSQRCKAIAVVEMNHGGQFADVVERIVHRPVIRIARVCAEPMSSEQIVRDILGEMP